LEQYKKFIFFLISEPIFPFPVAHRSLPAVDSPLHVDMDIVLSSLGDSYPGNPHILRSYLKNKKGEGMWKPRPFVIYYQQLNRLTDFNEIQYSRSLLNLLLGRELGETCSLTLPLYLKA
jgi:hypothetical protein